MTQNELTNDELRKLSTDIVSVMDDMATKLVGDRVGVVQIFKFRNGFVTLNANVSDSDVKKLMAEAWWMIGALDEESKG